MDIKDISHINDELSASARRVQDALRALGVKTSVVELPSSTRTAMEVANSIGCEIGQIVKSLIFQTYKTDQPIMVIASGANRVNENEMGKLVGVPIVKASPEFVRQCTGYAIGGIPPVGLSQAMKTFIDSDLFMFDEIWAAAGTPHAVFHLTPGELKKITGGKVTVVK